MAALETIRTRFGIGISIIIAISLLLFILDNNTLSKWFSGDNAKAHQVAVIDGESVTIEEFNVQVENLKDLYGGTHSADQEKQIREEAWQTFINKLLFVKNAEKAGIRVGAAEMKDITAGDHISPVIAQNFGTDPAVLSNFIEQNEKGWSYIYDLVRTNQYYAKYNALFVNSAVNAPLFLNKAIEENNVTANVDMVMVPAGFIQDTTINVSSSEIKKYYKEHKKFFKQVESRDIEYVLIEVVPSDADVEAAEKDFNNLYTDFQAQELGNVANFLLRNSSEVSYDAFWYKAGELNTVSREVNDYAFADKPAEVSPVFKSGNSFLAARVMATATRPSEIKVKVAPMESEELTAEVEAAVDAAEATPVTQAIKWAEPLFSAPLNKTQVVELPGYGMVAAKVVEVGEKALMKQVAVLKKTAIPSKETFGNFYSQANTMQSRSNGKLADFKSAAEELGLYVHTQNNILRNTERFGAVDNARELSNWAFKAKKGHVSDIITVNQTYFFVAALTNVHKEGYAPVSEVAEPIRNVLYMEKAVEKKAAEVAEKMEGTLSLEEVAERLGTTVSNRENIAFSSLSSQSVDPAFIGAVAAAKEGELCGPVKGANGVYVFRVNSRETNSFYTEDDAAANSDRIMQYSLQTILPVMMQDADVKDNRARFF
ncbi:MAG: SurA N-terminal domain-containing protein [Bacteroidales bacterium]|nr:SurA N-terminal domain-containing protein [Bacteroidales bacterium]